MEKLNVMQLSDLANLVRKEEHEVVLLDIVTTAISGKVFITDAIQNTPTSLRTFGFGGRKNTFVASNFIFEINEQTDILYSKINNIIALKIVYSNDLELEIKIESKGGF